MMGGCCTQIYIGRYIGIMNGHSKHRPLNRYVKLRMHWECWELFPCHWLQRKLWASNPGMPHGMCVTAICQEVHRLLMHWSYVFLALTPWYLPSPANLPDPYGWLCPHVSTALQPHAPQPGGRASWPRSGTRGTAWHQHDWTYCTHHTGAFQR